MEITVKILLVTLSCISIFSLMENTWVTIKRPDKFLARLEIKKRKITFINAYLILGILGYIGVMACGFYGMLFWIPDTWGNVDEDGQFISYRFWTTAFLTAASLFGILLFEDLARAQANVKALRQTIFGAEKIIQNAENLTPLLKGGELKKIDDADIFWLYEQAEELRRKISRIQNISYIQLNE